MLQVDTSVKAQRSIPIFVAMMWLKQGAALVTSARYISTNANTGEGRSAAAAADPWGRVEV